MKVGVSVLQNIQEMQRAAIQQQQQSEQLQERLAGLQDHQDGLDKRVKDASQVWLLPDIAKQILGVCIDMRHGTQLLDIHLSMACVDHLGCHLRLKLVLRPFCD